MAYNPNVANQLTGRTPISTKPNPIAPAEVFKPVSRPQPIKPKLAFYRDEGDSTVYDNTGRRYSNPKDFFNAGGKWENVQVKKKNKVAQQLTGGVGTSTNPMLPNYTPKAEVKPQPQQPFNMINEVAKVVVNPTGIVSGLAGSKPAVDFAKSIVQGTATSGAVAGQGVFDVAKGMTQGKSITEIAREVTKQKTTQFDPNSLSGKISNVLFGRTDLPSASQYGKETASLVPGGEGFAQRNPLAAFGLGLGASALDFTGAGKAKNAAKVLALTKDLTTAEKILKTAGVSDNLIKEFAPQIVKTTDEAGIRRILQQIDKKVADPRLLPNGKPKPGFSTLTPADVPATTRYEDLNDIGKAKARSMGYEPPKEPQVVSKERGFITSAKEAGMKVEGTDTFTTRNTEELAMKAKNLVKEDIVTAEKVAKGTDDKAVAVTSELIKHYDNLAKTATDEATKNLALDKISVIANETARNLTEAGRTVQAAKILNMQTPEGNLRFAAGLIQKYNDMVDKKGTGLLGLRKKIPELSREQAQEILDESKRVFDMAEGEEKAIAFQKLQEQINSLVPSSLLQKIITTWKAGLLTGLKTTGLNLSSSASFGGSEIAKDIPAAVVDKITSLITGKRTLALTGKGTASGVAEGFKKGLRYFRTGYDERNIAAKLDYNKVNFTTRGGKILQKYTDTVFNLLGAEDQPFYYGAKARSLYSQAIAEAKNLGLKGKELTSKVDELVANPTEDMIKYATHDAEVAVFQNKTALGAVAKGIQNVGKGAGEIVVPFGRTPAAVATQIINYSPVGIVKTIIENVGKGKFDQRLFSQGMGRALTGTGAIAIGTALYEKDMITLGYPKEAKERELWELEGRKVNSIKIGDKWRSIASLGPLGNSLLVGGYFQKALDETGSPTSALAQAGAGAAKSLTEQTFLQGLNSFTQAINDPSGYGPSLLGNLIGSTIPTLVGDVAQVGDPVQRRSSATKDGILTPMQAKIPGLREKLEPKVNVEGQQVLRPGNKLETLLDPTRPSKVWNSDTIKEMRRLSNTGNLATPNAFAEDKKFKIPPKDKTELQYSAGNLFKEKVNKLIKTEEYNDASDEEKAKQILDFADKSRQYARANYVQKQVYGLEGDELTAKLKQLKESGVMTKEVYTLWEKTYQ